MIITKEEERMAFIYSLASKHVTLSFLCKRCTFTGCRSVFVRRYGNITDDPSNVGKQSAFSCIDLYGYCSAVARRQTPVKTKAGFILKVGQLMDSRWREF